MKLLIASTPCNEEKDESITSSSWDSDPARETQEIKEDQYSNNTTLKMGSQKYSLNATINKFNGEASQQVRISILDQRESIMQSRLSQQGKSPKGISPKIKGQKTVKIKLNQEREMVRSKFINNDNNPKSPTVTKNLVKNTKNHV